MSTYKYIWKQSEDFYITYESKTSTYNSCGYNRQSAKFKEIEQYYIDHPESHFDGSTLTISESTSLHYLTLVSPLKREMQELEQWFIMYDRQIQQYNRAIRLNLVYDAKYGTIEELDAQAALNSQRISELRKQIEELEKNKPQQSR